MVLKVSKVDSSILELLYRDVDLTGNVKIHLTLVSFVRPPIYYPDESHRWEGLNLSRQTLTHIRKRCLGERLKQISFNFYLWTWIGVTLLSFLTLIVSCEVGKIDVDFSDRGSYNIVPSLFYTI